MGKFISRLHFDPFEVFQSSKSIKCFIEEIIRGVDLHVLKLFRLVIDYVKYIFAIFDDLKIVFLIMFLNLLDSEVVLFSEFKIEVSTESMA